MSKSVRDANSDPFVVHMLTIGGEEYPAHVLCDATGTPFSSTNPMPVGGAPITLTDRSGTVTVGGGGGFRESVAIGANAARKFLMIHNPETSGDLWYNTTGLASNAAGGGSVRLPPGAAIIFDTRVPNGAVSLFSLTSGKGYTVKEG